MTDLSYTNKDGVNLYEGFDNGFNYHKDGAEGEGYEHGGYPHIIDETSGFPDTSYKTGDDVDFFHNGNVWEQSSVGPGPEPPESPVKPYYGELFYVDEESEEVVNFYDENGDIIEDFGLFNEVQPVSYEIITPDPNGKPKYWVAGDEVDGKCWGYFGIDVGAQLDYTDFGRGKAATELILGTEDTSEYYENSIWKSLAEYNAAKTHGNGWFIGNEDEMLKLYSFYTDQAEPDNIFDGGSNDFVGCCLEDYADWDTYNPETCVLYQPSDGNYGRNWNKAFEAKWMYLKAI